ncbi:A-kinase anchor protein inhibitor 1 isoform X1 [Vulpes vulpes]|uniref:A-kinase anchor protein inhibitor 1 isoform X1 n=1 Tax=Vulpes vulpes TaxID=9627 RepID=A0A3Q7SXC7_VULVU
MRDAPSGIRSPPPAAAVAAGRAVHCAGRARRGGWSCGPGIARRELSAVLTSPAHARAPLCQGPQVPAFLPPFRLRVSPPRLGAERLEEIMVFAPGEKPGNEPEEVKLQKASKQIVQNAILQAVQQVSQESQQRGERTSDSRGSLQLGVGELTKKHEKK